MIAIRPLLASVLVLSVATGAMAQSARELYQRGLVEEQANGDLPRAIALYTQAVTAAGTDRGLAARAWVRVGSAREKLGRRTEAVSAYAELVRAYPEQRAEVAIARERLAVLRRTPHPDGGTPRAHGRRDISATRPAFGRYCAGCHSGINKAGGLDVDSLASATVGDNLPLWENVVRRLRARIDPPVGVPRPDDATYTALVSRVEQALDAEYAATQALQPVAAVSGVELATRVAAFLWNAAPDAALVEAAQRGELSDPAALRRQVVRMLRDVRSDALIDRFFADWLSLDRVSRAQPDPSVYPQFDADLRRAMETETRLFLQSQLHEDRDAMELWTADYTYVNDRLARHYGLPGVAGKNFVRAAWTTPARAGLLGQAGLLTALSQSSRTSPTVRGVYILTRFFGIDAPSPPANVPALAEGAQRGTLRDRLGVHKINPSCASCHGVFDPLGLSLENFDAIGAWRATDAGAPIDPSGILVDGSRFNGPAELRAGLLKFREAYYAGLVRQLMAYALNRKRTGGRVYDYEMPAVRKVVREAAADHYRWSSLLGGVIASAPFQMKAVVP
jgi:hypothetical protein